MTLTGKRVAILVEDLYQDQPEDLPAFMKTFLDALAEPR